MTRKECLLKTIEFLDKQPTTEEIDDMKHKIQEIISELPSIEWTDSKIRDSIEQFAKDTGKNPTVTDLSKKGLPRHTIIQYHYGISASEFLKQNYPQPVTKSKSKPYGHKTAEEWKRLFIEDYQRIIPKSGEDYNDQKKSYMPTWATIARLNGVVKWRDLIVLCGLKMPQEFRRPVVRRSKPKIEVNGTKIEL